MVTDAETAPGRRNLFHVPAWNLGLATLAFTLCFSAWGLIAPLAEAPGRPRPLEHRTAVMVSIPVVLGSLLRIPLGLLDRPLRRSPRLRGDARLLGRRRPCWSASRQLRGAARRRLPARRRRRLLRGRGPVRRRLVRAGRQGFALGVYGVGNIGTAVAAFSVPAIRDAPARRVGGIVRR